MHEIINEFDGNYAFLSNFYPSPVTYEGYTYDTVEHAYQAQKNIEARLLIEKCLTPAMAKKVGRSVPLRKDWDAIKVEIMKELVRLKFSKNPFRKWLLDTGDAYLEEGNDWGDTFWGTCKGGGLNMLGLILMEIRDEVRVNR